MRNFTHWVFGLFLSLALQSGGAYARTSISVDTLLVSEYINQPSCSYTTNGSIDISVSGGVSPIQYAWSTGAATEDISGLSSGTYVLTITDSGSPNAFVYSTFNWLYTNTGNNHTIFIPSGSISINGVPVTSGFVGIFYNSSSGLTCGGYKECMAGNNAVSAWGSQSGANDGFAIGESFKWKYWRPADGIELDLTATYQSVFSNDSTYSPNGISGVATLSGVTTPPSGSLSAVLSFSVTAPDTLDISEVISDYNGYGVSSNGSADGSVDITVQGGTSPYSYNWNDQFNSEDLNNLSAGYYLLTVYDNNQCEANAVVSITEPNQIIQPLSLGYSSTNLICAANCSGSIDLQVAGGLTPYSYQWSDGSLLEDRNALCAGTYDVTVYDQSNGITQSPFGWTYTNTGSNHVVLVQNNTVTVNGSSISPGDYIGIFYDQGNTLACARYNIYLGSSTAITAWGAQSGLNDGLAIGETFKWKIWRANDMSEVELSAVYDSNFPNGSTYQTNGMSSISSLSGVAGSVSAGDSIVASVTITEPAQLLLSTVISGSCTSGANSGAIDLTISGGISPYTIQWSSGLNSEDLSGLASGVYTVTVTDASSCTGTEIADLSQSSTLTISAIESNYSSYGVSTTGALDGWIDITAAGGVSPFTFLWSNGSVQEDQTNLGAGTYSVTVSDNTACVSSAQYTLTEPLSIAILTGSLNQSQPSCNLACDGALTISLSGGIAPFTYNWSNGANTASIDNLCAGSYEVTISDSGSGSNQAAPFNWTYTNTGTNHSILIPNGSASINGNALNQGDYIGVFYNLNGNPACAGYIEFTTGTSAVTAWGAQSGGSDGFALGEEFQWKVWRSIDSTIVNMMAIYSSSFPNNNVFAPNGMTGLSSLSGSTVTNTSSQSIVLSALIIDPDPINVSATLTAPSCYDYNDGQIDISVSNVCFPINYNWSTGYALQDLPGASAGTYSVTVTCSTGCTAVESFSLSEPTELSTALVTSDYSGYELSLYGASDGWIDLSVSGGTSPYLYSWSDGAASEDVSNLNAGNYDVTVTDDNGCQETESAVLTQPEPLNTPLVLNYTVEDNDCNSLCDGEIDLTVSGGVLPYTYNWSNSAASSEIDNLCAGTYTVTITDSSLGTLTTSAFDWTYNNTGINHIILIPIASTSIDGAPIQNGDYIGVFYNQGNSLSCGGYKLWTGTTTALTAWGSQSSQNDGFAIGEEFKWKVWRAADSTVVDMTASYQSVFANAGNYITNGMSGITSLTGSSIPSVSGQSIVQSFIINQADPISIASTVTHVDCHGNNNGSINLTISGGVSPFTILWNNNASSVDLNGLSAGYYSYTVSDSNGCQDDGTIEISEPTNLIISLSAINPACYGTSTGQVSITVNGGSNPYSYSWSNGSQQSSIQNIYAGQYCISVTDNNACSAADCVILLQPDTLQIQLTGNDLNCFEDYSGSISTVVTGGSLFYQYSWSNGAIGSDLINLGSGNYGLTVSDQNGCSSSSALSLSEPTALTLSAQLSDYSGFNISVYLASDGWIDLSTSGGSQPYSYAWSNGGNIDDLQNISAGSYVLTLTDSNGCSVIETFNLTQPALVIDPLTVSTQLTELDCNGDCNAQIDLTPSGGITPYSYLWSNGATSQNVDQLCAGTYEVSIYDSNFGSISGQPFTWSYTNTGNNHVVALPVGSIIVDGVTAVAGDVLGLFFDQSGSLSCGGYFELTNITGAITAWGTENGMNNGFAIGESFNWKLWRASDGAIIDLTPSYSTNFFNLGTYTINGMSGVSSLTGSSPVASIGDSLIVSYTINNPAPLSLTGDVQQISCNGQADASISLLISGGNSPYTINWNNGSSGTSLSSLAGGSYAVTVSDANGCTIADAYQILTTDPLNLSSSVSDISCFGLADGSIDLSVNGGTSPYQFNWSNNSISEDLASLSAGTFTVSVYDINNCLSSQSFTINEPAQLSITLSTINNTCYDSSTANIQVNVQGGISPYNYNWSNGENGSAIDNLNNNTYCVTISDQNGCSISQCEIVSGPTELVVSGQTTDNLCYNQPAGIIDISVSGGVSPYSYLWAYGEISQDLNTLTAGLYTVTVTDGNGCSQIGDFQIISPDELVLNLSETNVSVYNGNDGAIDLTVLGGISPYSFIWSNGATSEDISALSAGIFSVSVTDTNACLAIDERGISEPLGALGTISEISCNNGCDGAIDIQVGGGISPYTFQWSNGTLSEDIDQLCAGSYELTIFDSNTGSSEAFNWSYNVTGINHTIAIPLGIVTIDGSALSNGDYIGVFFHNGNELSCGGYQLYGGITTAVTAWGAETGVDNGFVNGEAFIWKVWQAADSSVVDMTATYTSIMPNQGTYVANGMSGLSSLSGTNLANVLGDSIVISYSISSPDPLSIDLSGISPSCFAESDGSVNSTVTGGSTPYSYSWSNGSQTASLTGLAAGTYSLTIIDVNSCEDIETIEILEPAQIAVSLSTTDVLCAGDSNGTIQALISGGLSPYQYSWSTASTLSTIANLSSGEYHLTVSDNNQCQTIVSTWIYEPNQLSLNLNTNDPSCYGFNNGSIQTTLSGGVSPYSYVWSNGATTPDLLNEGLGYYCLAVQDANGCNISECAILFEPEALNVMLGAVGVSCYGEDDGVVAVTIAGGTPAFSYSWSNGSNNNVLTGITAGIYELTVTDSNNCQASGSTTVSEPGLLTANGIAQQITCFGDNNGSIDLSISGGSTPYSYNWSSSATSEDLANLSIGTYQATVTDANACVAESSIFSIEQAQQLTIALYEQHVSCNGGNDGEIAIIANGGVQPYAFLWSNGSANMNQFSLIANNYCVTLSDDNGCTVEACKTIFEPIAITTYEQIALVSCAGGSDGAINLTINGGTQPYQFSWSNGEFSEDLIQLSAATYTVTISDLHGCTIIESYTISEPDPLSYVSSIQNIDCFGGNNGEISVEVSGGVSPYNFNWSNGVLNHENENLPVGQYELTISDDNGCTNTATFNLSQPDQVLITLSETNASCFNSGDGSILSVVGGGVSPYTYNWSQGSTSVSIDNLGVGSYTLYVNDANNCVADASASINQPDEIIISTVFNDPLCYGDSNGSIILNLSGGISPFSFSWANGSSDQNQDNLTVGVYCVTATDASGCTSTICAELTEPLDLDLTIIHQDLSCYQSNDGSIELIVSGGTGAYGYIWNNGSTNNAINNLAIGNYEVTVNDANGCTANESVSLIQPDQVVVDLGADATINMGESIIIDAGIFNNYLWNTGALTQTIEVQTEGDYWATVYTVNGCSGSDSLHITVNPYLTQMISLSAGWNLMSFNVTPINLNIASILDTIVSSIDIAKNGNGEMFWPFYGVNLIGDVATGEGYSIKLSNPETLYVEGMIVVPELTPIQIPAGNSILGYLRQDAAPVSVMLSPIVSSIQIVKNELGLMYWPYFGINLLGNMEPGEGYNIKLQNSETLIYPANSMNFAKSTIINESTEHFIIDANTGSNMTLGIPEEAWITKPDHGDEIGLFNKNNELVGSGLYRGDHMAISLWGDDETTNEIEYLGLSESFQMVLWKAADNSLTQLSVSEWKQGSNQFSDKAIAVVGKFARTTDAVLSSQLMQNYPNPFIYNSDISIELNSSSEIELNLYNSLGEKLFEIAHGSYSTGIHTFTVDGSKLATGHYYYKLSSSDGVITKKMQKI